MGGIRRSNMQLVDDYCQVAHHASMSTTSTMNIALPEPLRTYVAQRVESGEYDTGRCAGQGPSRSRSAQAKGKAPPREETLVTLIAKEEPE